MGGEGSGRHPSEATILKRMAPPMQTPIGSNIFLPDYSGVKSGAKKTDTLTAGSIIFSDGTKLTQDNSKLFWDDTNNRLGIGTTSPDGSIGVNGQICFKGGVTGSLIYNNNQNLIMGWTSDSNAAIQALSVINFKTYNGSAYSSNLYIKGGSGNSGQIGIGVTSPTAALHLKASTAAADTASLKIDAGTLATAAVSGNIESDGTHLYWTDSGGTRRQLDN